MAALLGACAPLRPCEPTHSLYVVSHGLHRGVVVEREALEQRRPELRTGGQRYLEIGWGEERYYQARDAGPGLALRAVLQPNTSVLQVVAFDAAPRSHFPSSEVAEVRTDAAGYGAALAFIAGAFSPPLERLGPSLYGEGAFYRAQGSFHLFNNCHTWVTAVLEQAACDTGPR